MNRWKGQVAVVTGASQGNGFAIATELVKNEIVVIGLSRNEQKLQEVATKLNESYTGKFYGRKCNIRNETDIADSFEWICKNFGPVSILINNAGVFEETTILETNYEMMRRVLETNFMGGVLCTKMAVQSMINHSIDGHIINISSVCGQPQFKPWHGISPIHVVSKHGVTIITDALHRELMKKNTKIKTTNISPGVIETEMLVGVDLTKFGENVIPLQPKDVADACITTLSTSPNVQISELIIKPIGEI